MAVELYSLTKVFSLAGWRVGFVVRNAEVVHALGRLKSYLDYGTFQPIQIAAITTLREAAEFPEEVNEVYRAGATRSATGWPGSGGRSSGRGGRCSSGRGSRTGSRT